MTRASIQCWTLIGCEQTTTTIFGILPSFQAGIFQPGKLEQFYTKRLHARFCSSNFLGCLHPPLCLSVPVGVFQLQFLFSFLKLPAGVARSPGGWRHAPTMHGSSRRPAVQARTGPQLLPNSAQNVHVEADDGAEERTGAPAGKRVGVSVFCRCKFFSARWKKQQLAPQEKNSDTTWEATIDSI